MAKLKSNTKARFKSAGKAAGAAPSSSSKAKSNEGLQDKAEHLSRSIMDSAQQIWLAGMGAFARAQQEGTKMFETLVSEGMTIEKRTRKMATGGVDAVRDAVESRVGQVKDRATDTWDRLEKVFEDRVQRALIRLGVPGRDDLKALIARVDQLNAELRKLSAKPATAATRPAVKKAVPRKPASPKGAVKSKPSLATRPAVTKAPVKRATPAPAPSPAAAPTSEAAE